MENHCEHSAHEETQEAFLEELGEKLKAAENTDVELADILKTNILHVSPALGAVMKAKEAILLLARERAGSQNVDSANG